MAVTTFPTGRSETKRWGIASILAASAIVLTAVGGSGCGAPTRGAEVDRLTIGAYSVLREALREGILPAFARHRAAATGREVVFEESYNASGALTRSIVSGFDADVALLSIETDMDQLARAGRVASDWRATPHGGMITRSLVVIGVRPGNPLAIADWSDLAEPGVDVLYPDPKTSGGARWNLFAIWGAGLLGSDRADEAAAESLMRGVQRRVVNMDASGRQSLASFARGIGDAAVTYENELRLRERRLGSAIESVVPRRTLLIEGPAAIVETSVAKHGNRELADDFLRFLHGEEGQAILSEFGFRPLGAPLPEGVFTLRDLDGAAAIQRRVFGDDGIWNRMFTDRTEAR